MNIKFNLSYKFNKLQKIHNNKFNRIENKNFEELLNTNSQNKDINIYHFNMSQGPTIKNTNSHTTNNQLLTINNQYLDDELINIIDTSNKNNYNNNISYNINNSYKDNNYENLNSNDTSYNNSNSNNQNTKIDLSPSTVDYKNSKGDVFDKTKAKPSYSEIESLVVKYAKKYNIEPSLAMAIINTESTFNNQCISKSGAVGLTQLMPSTAREMGLRVDSTIDERWDPEKNIEAGIAYLAKYHKIISNHFQKEDWNLTIAGYNCGPNRVIREGKIPNIKETQNYVKKVNKYWNQFK